ncbi:MAG TPA: M55 family metallopeptidase [Chthoniobacteraceae bacterium]|nr:M55 family metallopeptidase [Chthoniobacteraceae bacterium]
MKQQKKIYILVDMEGISGICRASQVRVGELHYPEGRLQMTREVNACVEACLEAGATEVVVRDVHGTCFNLVFDQLHPGARYIMGESQMGRMPGIRQFDGLILLGYHAMAGTPFGVLEHTANSLLWQNFWLNGVKAGEIAVDAGIAGDHGVPVIMVSGDDKTVAETEAFLPHAVKAEVKQGIGIEGAIFLSPGEARRVIQEKTREAVKRCAEIPPFMVEKPVTLRLQLVSRGRLPRHRQGFREIDGQTFEVTAPSVQQAVYLIEG